MERGKEEREERRREREARKETLANMPKKELEIDGDVDADRMLKHAEGSSAAQREDGDERRVPEMQNPPPLPPSASASASASSGGDKLPTPARKRGGSSADKEHKRLKRLLRNRVSAQQARERKKVYLTDLEIRGRDLEQHNAELEEKVSTLQRENFMLRQIVKNTALKKNNAL